MVNITFRYKHFRYDRRGHLRRYFRGNSSWAPTNRGGMTICVISTSTGLVGIGEAICLTIDPFCYAEGRGIARDKAEREIWRVDNIQEDEECCGMCECDG